ncbi:MAG TPA: M2 family metallopeptidase [Thermoanaerobaculia bacterium]|nr:M2 family metallopeptidase [Thermoanaerobaculia bacterium]
MRDRFQNGGALLVLLFVVAALASGCATAPPPPPAPAPAMAAEVAMPAGPTIEEAERFAEMADARLAELDEKNNRAQWLQANFITHDTQLVASAANEALITAGVELAKEAARFDALDLSPETRRKLDVLKLKLTTPGPSDPEKTRELTRLASGLEARYGSGKYCDAKGKCLDVSEITRIMATIRNPGELLDAWRGWRTISPPMREEYRRFVELTNEGARELGYDNAGAMWRSNYDMPPDEFTAEVDRLWGQVKPLYDSLHCFVRWNLTKVYGETIVPPGRPIPAHLLGNIWAQEWANVYDLVAPKGSDPGYDLTALLKKKKVDAVEMVRYGERFFTSLGFDPLPATFWERSLFTKPEDREVVCHASAWDLDNQDDLRIKMCIDITAEDFQTVHHELGHNFYQRAYKEQPFLFKDSANDGFHEAVGDAIALSVTPSYLVKVGLLDKEPPTSKDLGLLLREALDKVAFLPFGLLIDQWRWKVFSGEVTPANYNAAWWELRERYQGVRAPVARSESDFDPGAKYHIPANVPYTRYFLARILQFQFHEALCRIAGYEGPLNRCSIYGNEEAGARLDRMLSMGRSRPWPEALEALTGTRRMDATSLVNYFAPLKVWLDEQNRGQTCGW